MRLCLIAAVACVAARASFARAIGDAARHAREIVPEESGAAQPGTTDLNNLRDVRSSETCSVGASALDKVIDDLVTMEMLEHGDFCLNCVRGLCPYSGCGSWTHLDRPGHIDAVATTRITREI